MKKICLINAPCEWRNSVTYQKTLPYQGIFSIAAYMSQQCPHLEISILDGNILSNDEIKKKIDTKIEIFGFSIFIYNYKNTILLSEYVKEVVPGCKIIYGGPLATAIPELIMKNRRFLDYIITLEGEIALTDLVKGKPIETINNLVYRKNGKIFRNPSKPIDLNNLPRIDYRKFTDLEIYLRNADRLNEKRKLPMYASKGCKWRECSKKYCIFCSLMYPEYRVRSPEGVWEEIEYLKSLGAEEILDASDNFMEDMHWFKHFHNISPNIDIDLKVYSRADSLTEETVRMLKDLRCTGVLIGIESNSDTMLRNFNKIARKKDNHKALTLLRKYNIMPRVTMILGGLGETEMTANETLAFANEYLWNDCWVTCSILKPIPSSIAFDMMMQNPKLKEKYQDIDILDYDELSKDWVKNFCRVDYSTLIEIEKKILNVSSKICSWDSNMTLI